MNAFDTESDDDVREEVNNFLGFTDKMNEESTPAAAYQFEMSVCINIYQHCLK